MKNPSSARHGVRGAAEALDRAAMASSSSAPAEAARSAREDVLRMLRESSSCSRDLVASLEADLVKLDAVDRNADLWVSQPIRRCMAKLEDLDTHNLDHKHRELLTDLACCQRNLRCVSNDVKEFVVMERRVKRCGQALRGIVDGLDSGRGRAPERGGHSRSSSSSDLSVSVCSDAADDVNRRRVLFGAYLKLMRPPASPRLVRALRDSLGRRGGPIRYEEFDTVAHAWLEEWRHLTSILEAVFRSYLSVAQRSPLLLVECLKIVEVHENVAEGHHRTLRDLEAREVPASLEERDLSLVRTMMPVLEEAAEADRERGSADGAEVHENLTILLVRCVSDSVRSRVRDVANQAFYAETTAESRSLVLDALVEDLWAHHDEVNALFPGRYNMATTIPTFYSEHLASCLRDLAAKIAEGNQVGFSNADVLGLISWIERFVSGMLGTSSTGGDAQRVGETLNGELLSQLGSFREIYVARSAAKLREWMRGILAKDTEALRSMTPERAESGPLPLLSAGPIDVFSAIQSELHTTLEEVSDPALAALSACSMADLILEHAEGYEAAVEATAEAGETSGGASNEAKGLILTRSSSSPAAFAKAVRPILSGTGVPESIKSGRWDPGPRPATSASVEQLCLAANSCSVYHSEASEVVRLVEDKIGFWDLAASASGSLLISASLGEARAGLGRFEKLMRSSILRFQRGSTLCVSALVGLILRDVGEVLGGLFGEDWLLEGNRCVETVCATIHDYCVDTAEYLRWEIYSRFLASLFDEILHAYLTGESGERKIEHEIQIAGSR